MSTEHREYLRKKYGWWWNANRDIEIFLEPVARIWRMHRLHRNILVIEKITAGEWWDTDTIMFHGLFQMLVDYVEGELGYCYQTPKEIRHLKSPEWQEIHQNKFDWAYASWLDRNVRRRRYWKEKLAIAHLDWEISLKEEDWNNWDDVKKQYAETDKPSHQAEMAKIKKELYLWYKHEYPARPDPYYVYDDLYKEAWPVTGIEADKILEQVNDSTSELGKKRSVWSKKVYALEEKYEQEDEDKMIQLIKIRRSLWT